MGITCGSGQERPPSVEADQISSLALSPCVASDHIGSPGVPIGVRWPYKYSFPCGSRLTEAKIDQRSARCGQMGRSSCQVSPRSREREITGTKSLLPSFAVRMYEHSTSPELVTAVRVPTASGRSGCAADC